jgi:hypothetical protein
MPLLVCGEHGDKSLKLFVPWNMVRSVVPIEMVRNVEQRNVTINFSNTTRTDITFYNANNTPSNITQVIIF